MKRKVKAAREKIMTTAKRYGWDTWVKIQEPVESPPPKKMTLKCTIKCARLSLEKWRIEEDGDHHVLSCGRFRRAA